MNMRRVPDFSLGNISLSNFQRYARNNRSRLAYQHGVVELHIEKKNERTAICRENVQGVTIPSSRGFSSLST